MNTQSTAIVKNEGGWWIGWINGKRFPESTAKKAAREEILETLRVTLRETLSLNRDDAVNAAGDESRSQISHYETPRPD